MFLPEEEVVVPTTVMRAFPLDWYRERDRGVDATMRRTRSVVVVIQAFLQFVGTDDVWNEDRFNADTTYARYWGNLNILTYLIRHNDSNEGNFLRSVVAENPRIFSVDNGVAFSNEESDRGTYWRNIEVKRFPAKSIERLRQVTAEGLQQSLGVVAQFELQGGQFVPVAPTANLDPGDGVRHNDSIIQLGLTDSEIRQVYRRLEQLLEWVDGGRYTVFQ
jgi:hypothetical protein